MFKPLSRWLGLILSLSRWLNRRRNRQAPAVDYSLLKIPRPLNLKHFHDLIAEVVNNLDGDAA